MATSGLPARGLCGALSATLLLAGAGLGLTVAPAHAAVAAVRMPAGTITTVAGGIGGPGPARHVSVRPCAVKSVPGALYIGTGSAVRRVDPRTGWLTNPVTKLTSACGVTTDAAGNLLVADDAVVRVVAKRTGRFDGRHMSAGHTYTIAGQAGKGRYFGDTGNDGPAAKALLSDAVDVTLDHHGNVLIADAGQPRYHLEQPLGSMVRLVAERDGRFYGRQMIAGNIYTVAGAEGGLSGNGVLATNDYLDYQIGTVRVDHAGNLVLADSNGQCVHVIAVRTGTFYGQKMTSGHIYAIAGNPSRGGANYSDGVLATKATMVYAGAAAIDHAGNLVIADCTRVRVVAVRGGKFYGRQMSAGRIYSIAGTGFNPPPPTAGCIVPNADTGDGGPAGKAVINATWVTVDSAGNVVIADAGNRVRVLSEQTGHFYGQHLRTGDIYTIAGNGQAQDSGLGLLATRAELNPGGLTGLTRDHAGDLIVSDASHGRVLMVPVAAGRFFGRMMLKGHIYAIAGSGRRAGKLGNGGPAIKARMGPGGLSMDAAGNLLVTDGTNHGVRVLVARSGIFYGQHMTADHIYTIAGNGSSAYSGDGGPATKAGLGPSSVAVDRAGNVLVADNQNNRIRIVAARTGIFYGRHLTARHIYTIAGNGNPFFSGDGRPAAKAGLQPLDIGIDAVGNLVVADAINDRVRVVAARSGTFYRRHMIAGDIYTIAGTGGCSGLSARDGGPAIKANLCDPEGVAIDSAGNVAIAVSGDAVIRMVPVRSGRFYGKKMTTGRIYTVAGTTRPNYYGGGTPGDGGPATRAQLSSPRLVAIGRIGNLLIGDWGNGTVRSVSR
jgi:trimeric autotransporter adhesin